MSAADGSDRSAVVAQVLWSFVLQTPAEKTPVLSKMRSVY